MPIISPGRQQLFESIQSAFSSAKESGSKDGANSDEIVFQLSSDIADAIDKYVTSITVQINPGGTTALGDTIVTPQLS